MRTFRSLTFCVFISFKIIHAQEHLPDPPSNYIERLSFTEEINETNSMVIKGTRPLSNTDLGKLKPKKTINNVVIYLEQNGTQKKYITTVYNSEQQPYFSQIKTTYLDGKFICLYDHLDILINRTPFNPLDSINDTYTNSLLFPKAQMDSTIINELIQNGATVSYEKDKYWLIRKDNQLISLDLKNNIEVSRELNADKDNWLKYEYIELSPEENYFLKTTSSSVYSLKNGGAYKSIVTKTRSDFNYYRSNNVMNNKRKSFSKTTASNIITKINDNLLLINNRYQNVDCKIINISGDEILNFHNCSNAINISGLMPGAYIIQLSGNFGIYTDKFFKTY